MTPDPIRLSEVERVTEIRERAEAASPGPWRTVRKADVQYVINDETTIAETGAFAGDDYDQGITVDAEFIAHAPDDIRHLLDLVDRLTAAVRAVEAMHQPQQVATSANSIPGHNPHMVTRRSCQPEWRGYPCPTIAALAPFVTLTEENDRG